MATPARRLLPAAAAILALTLAGCAPDVMAGPRSQATSAPTTVVTDQPGATESLSPVPEPEQTQVAEVTPEADPAPSPTAATPSEQPAEDPEPTAAAGETLIPEAEPEPLPTQAAPPPALFKEGDSGDDVRDLQHRLVQLEWYEGKIDGEFGPRTRLAVEGFQAKRGLPLLGFVDEATLGKLRGMTRQPTHDEMYNILKPGPALFSTGTRGDKVKDIQARLKQLEWYTAKVDGIYGEQTVAAVKGFQEKREIPVTGEVDQRTLDRLNGMTRRPTADELNNVPPKQAAPAGFKLDDRCLTGRVICVSKQQRKLAWVVDGKILMTMQVRFGSELTPTRNGVFSVGWKSRDHVSKLYKTPMPYALFFSGGQAIHYSRDFAARGYNGASHGCVNVRDKAAVAALFDAARTGDRVVVFEG